MKLGKMLLVVLLLACPFNAVAQAPAKNDVKDWAEQWQMAAEKYDYKPVKEVGTFGEQL